MLATLKGGIMQRSVSLLINIIVAMVNGGSVCLWCNAVQQTIVESHEIGHHLVRGTIKKKKLKTSFRIDMEMTILDLNSNFGPE